jgi:diguanylate cyclase (GGDEF)-like protein
LSGLTFRLLGFPKDLEHHFEETTRKSRCRRLWLEGLLAIALFDGALLLDHLFVPQPSSHMLVVRLGLITTIAVLINSSMLFQPGKLYRESSIALFACMAALSELSLQSNISPVHTVYAQFTAVAVLVFANTVIRLRFGHAIAASIVVCLGVLYFSRVDVTMPFGTRLLGLTLSLSTILLTLIANYSQNREERLNFLLCLHAERLIEKLEDTNVALGIAAEKDGLTALTNRYAFDRKLVEVWQNARDRGQVVSLILIDVDHFKHLNDRFGHLYGDKVLRRVAHLLSESLRRKEDVAARFGGEEFVILLPGTGRESARLVAERLRKLVELAGFPALETPDGILQNIHATVSCGVATASPIGLDDAYLLLDAADKALYRAKGLGRNMVCFAEEAESIKPELQRVS